MKKFLTENLKESPLYKKDKGEIICLACRRYCRIKEGGYGFCKVRFNMGGKLYAPYGYVSSLAFDPIEKKPLYHFLPGYKTLSFGMFGCNFNCLYCQNYEISQAGEVTDLSPNLIDSGAIIKLALENKIEIIVSTYNEPTVSLEWAKEIFSKFKVINKNFKTGFVSNGYISQEAVDYLSGFIDFIKIDLKSFDKEKHRKLSTAELSNVLNSIRYIYSKKNIWIEIVTPIVIGFNDSLKEIKELADFIVSLSRDIPLHLTAFHPDYKMRDFEYTDPFTIKKLADISKKAGLRYVYGGNISDIELNSTYCPECGKLLIERVQIKTIDNKLKAGTCPFCNFRIAGIWR